MNYSNHYTGRVLLFKSILAGDSGCISGIKNGT